MGLQVRYALMCMHVCTICDSSSVVLCTRSRSNDPVQVMDEAKDSVPSLQLSKQEILTGYRVHMHNALLY